MGPGQTVPPTRGPHPEDRGAQGGERVLRCLAEAGASEVALPVEAGALRAPG